LGEEGAVALEMVQKNVASGGVAKRRRRMGTGVLLLCVVRNRNRRRFNIIIPAVIYNLSKALAGCKIGDGPKFSEPRTLT
jgi:hypothetical protein